MALISLPATLLQQPSPASKPPPNLEQLQRRLADQSEVSSSAAPPTPSASKELLKLFGDVTAPAPHPPAKTHGDKSDARGNSWAIQVGAPRYDLASVGIGARTPSPGIWTQVARCWHGSAASPPVELQFTLDSQGGLAQTPQASGVSDLRALDEARRALAACAPYSAPLSTRTFVIRFGAGENG